jgi:hypothetical protein
MHQSLPLSEVQGGLAVKLCIGIMGLLLNAMTSQILLLYLLVWGSFIPLDVDL